MHISLGGDRFRVRLSNAFGKQAVTIGAAHLAVRAEKSKIAPGSDRALTFSGRPSIAIPPGALVLSDPVDLKAPDSADLAVSFYLPGGPAPASTVHYSAQQTSYVAAGDATGAVEIQESATIASWVYLTGVDVLGQPGVKYVVVFEGVNDIGHPGGTAPMSEDVTAEDMIAGLRQLIERAHERGLRIFGGTILPFTTAGSPKDLKRQAVNQWIVNGKAFDGVIDFDKRLRDPAQTNRLLALYDSGDGLHPNDAGLQAMGETVDLSLFSR